MLKNIVGWYGSTLNEKTRVALKREVEIWKGDEGATNGCGAT